MNFPSASAKTTCLALSTGNLHVDWKCRRLTKPPSRPNLQQYLYTKPCLFVDFILAAQNFPSAQTSILDPFWSFDSASIDAAKRSWLFASSFISATKNRNSSALHDDDDDMNTAAAAGEKFISQKYNGLNSEFGAADR